MAYFQDLADANKSKVIKMMTKPATRVFSTVEDLVAEDAKAHNITEQAATKLLRGPRYLCNHSAAILSNPKSAYSTYWGVVKN